MYRNARVQKRPGLSATTTYPHRWYDAIARAVIKYINHFVYWPSTTPRTPTEWTNTIVEAGGGGRLYRQPDRPGRRGAADHHRQPGQPMATVCSSGTPSTARASACCCCRASLLLSGDPVPHQRRERDRLPGRASARQTRPCWSP